MLRPPGTQVWPGPVSQLPGAWENVDLINTGQLMTTQESALREPVNSRQVQIARYQANLQLQAGAKDRTSLFNVHGAAGVGKTYLTRQLREIATSEGALTAWTDEAGDVTSALVAIAAELKRGGANLDEFEKLAQACVQRSRRAVPQLAAGSLPPRYRPDRRVAPLFRPGCTRATRRRWPI
jgi:hypothetical protein